MYVLHKIRTGTLLTDCKTKSRIRISTAVLGDGTRQREPSSHLTETLHHAEDSNTSDSITEKNRDRTSMREGGTDSEEETGSDSATEGNELNVSGLEASLYVSKFFGSLDITIEVSSLADVVALCVDNILDAMV